MQTTDSSHQDVESLATKLATFTQSLSPGERAMFELVEAQLAGLVIEDDEAVVGYSFNPYLLDIAQQRQAEFQADAAPDHQVRAYQAATWATETGTDTGSQRSGYWRTVLGSLTTQPQTRWATDASSTT